MKTTIMRENVVGFSQYSLYIIIFFNENNNNERKGCRFLSIFIIAQICSAYYNIFFNKNNNNERNPLEKWKTKHPPISYNKSQYKLYVSIKYL
jgi:hypothetical protein